MSNFTLTQEQYEALISFARLGAPLADERRRLDAFLTSIETANNVTRSKLWIQWQETDQPLPPTARFPESWPPTQRYYLELLTRPVNREDVTRVLTLKARRPVTVLVTPDPGATLGWTPVDDYFTA